MKRLLILLLALIPASTFAQGVRYDNIAIRSNGLAIAAPTVNVCTGITNPLTTCTTGNASLFSDVGLTVSQSNPTIGDNLGNYGFYIAPGNYTLTISASGISPVSFAITLSPNTTAALKPAASDAIQFVSTNGSDANDGLSRGSAKASWQAAINAAAAAQPSHGGTGTVVVLPGLYLTNSAVTQTANVNVFAYGAELRAGASFPTSTTLYTIGSSSPTETTMLFGATLNCNSVAGCLALSGPNLNEQAGFADVTINHAMAGCLSVGTTSQNWTMGSLDCLMDATAPNTAIPIVIKGTGTLIPGSGNYGHWTIGGTNTATLPEDIEIYNVGGMSLSDIHMEAKATDGILLTGSAGIGSNLITVKNVTGNSDLTNVVHEDSTNGNGNNVFMGIAKIGATNALKDDVTGATFTSSVSAYIESPSFSSVALTSSGGGSITHQAPNTASNFTITDPAFATTLTGTVASGTATMTTGAIGSGACGATVTVSATGTLTTDTITYSFNASVAANPGELTLRFWPTSGNVNFEYCNPTAASVTPNAATLNWKVVR